MRRALIVVGKAPTAGGAKTRLMPPLSAEEAAAVYRAFLLDTVQLALSLGWERTCVVHPRGDGPPLHGLLQPRHVHLLEQPTNGLGNALAFAFERHFAAGFDSVMLIGSDTPTLPATFIEAAGAALEAGEDLAIGPSCDGGYYLIGMRQSHLGVFAGIEWSTSRVFAQTMDRAHELRLQRLHVLPEWYDVDEPEDLDRLRDELATAPPDAAPHTRAVLQPGRYESGGNVGGTSTVGVRPERSA